MNCRTTITWCREIAPKKRSGTICYSLQAPDRSTLDVYSIHPKPRLDQSTVSRLEENVYKRKSSGLGRDDMLCQKRNDPARRRGRLIFPHCADRSCYRQTANFQARLRASVWSMA